MKSTLVIGWREGNLADELLPMLRDGDRSILVAGKDELDVLDTDAVANAVLQHGPFNEIVYCAGINELTWIPDITVEALQKTYGVNVFGLIDVVARHVELYPGFHTRVVAVVSDASRVAMRGSLMYCSSKTALIGVIRNMARELAPKVTVIGVSPGVIDDTPMTDYIDRMVPELRGWTPEQARAYEAAAIPMGRRTTKHEVAQTMMFALDGPDALTGSIIEITGGK